MFRTEERNQLEPGGVGEDVDSAAALARRGGVIGNEAHVLAAKRRELLRLENIEAGLHACRAARMFRGGARRQRAQKEQRQQMR